MFKAVIKPESLNSIIASISSIQTEIRMGISPDGLRIETVDPANVAMVSLVAGKDAFEHFEATNCEIAVDIDKLGSMIGKGEPISMELDEANHKLRIKQGRSSFIMSLIDPSSLKANPRIPSIDLPCAVTIAGSDLYTAVKNAVKVCEAATLEQNEDTFSIVSESGVDSFRADFVLSELSGIRQGISRSLFSLEYLEDIAKVASGNETTVETGVDYPSRIMFSVGKDIAVSYLLAPRIEQN